MTTETEIAPQMTPEQEKNWEVALRINREARANPDSPYANQCIAVSQEQVVAQGKDFEELISKTRAMGLDPKKFIFIETNIDYDRTYQFGGFR